MKKYPQFMIIGAARSGTSSLHRNLETHPQLQGPKLGKFGIMGYDKETHFFDNGEKFRKGLPWYLKLWPQSDGKINFESTPNYLYKKQVPERIQETIPNWRALKFIIMLRDPVMRAWSHYWHWKEKYNKPPERVLDPNLDLIRKGIYIEQILNWHRYFKKHQFLIIKSEDYYQNEDSVLINVCLFLGIDVVDWHNPIYYDPKKPNSFRRAKYPPIPKNIKAWLSNYYRPYNRKLFDYLGAEFKDWS